MLESTCLGFVLLMDMEMDWPAGRQTEKGAQTARAGG
jgi:hypothetical protein